MATQAKQLDKQASRQELLEAFKLFDANGDGEVTNFENIIRKIYQCIKHHGYFILFVTKIFIPTFVYRLPLKN